MLFSSLSFLVWFLPIVMLGHFFMPGRFRNAFLLLASLVFYAFGEIRYVPLLLLMMAANFGLGLLMGSAPRQKRLWLALSILVNMGALVFFKYTGFLFSLAGLSAYAPNVTMPLGISFFTFQTQSYAVDVYRGRVKPERNPVSLMTYILLFPQLIAGPIVLYTDVEQALRERTVDAEKLEEGVTRLILGLSMKVLLANPLGETLQHVLSLPSASAPLMWLATLLGVLQLYFDFAGYSLMAIGMGRMMGFSFPRNFNYPFAARSMRAFWRRWHITLGTWMRDYLYLPLGGSKRGPRRTLFNLLVVWVFSGLWHGADLSHLFWGLWFFLWIALERGPFGRFLDGHPRFGFVCTQLCFFLGWPLFHYAKLGDAARHLGRMFSLNVRPDLLFYLRDAGALTLLALFFAFPFSGRLLKKIPGRARPYLLILLLVLCMASLVNERYNPFIYFRF